MTPSLSDPQGEYEQFLYTVSHDLQEPLRMVTSFLHLLDKKAGDQLDDDARKYLNLSVENAERMKQMINALVDLSRVNRATEDAHAVDLCEILTELVALYKSTRSVEIELTCEAAEKVSMPPQQALQLIRILLDNAVDNKPTDQPLRLRLSCLPAGGERVTCTFEDNGAGMPELFTERVFDIFRQVRKNPSHIGAGLTIAKAIVVRQNGSISLESTEGQSTVVTFDLPGAAT